MPIVSGRTACEISAAGIGMAVGAIGSGASGGTLTLPAMVLGAGVGYLFGRVVCRIPAVERAFDRALSNDDWRALEQAFADPKVRQEAVAVISDEIGVTPAQAETTWDAVVMAVMKQRDTLVDKKRVQGARHHPPAGATLDGVARVRQAIGSAEVA